MRCSLLREPRTVENDWTYGGCKSWVPLKNADVIDDADARPVLIDGAFAEVVRRLEEAMR